MKYAKGVSTPQNYLAAVLENAGNDLKIIEKEIPSLNKGEVLIQLHAAPLNPSDLAMLDGVYPHKKTYPFVPGLEGSGTVVASGGGFMANYMLGKRVACSANDTGDGTWAQYMKVKAGNCIPLNKDLNLDQAASAIVNPLTAVALVEIVKAKKEIGFVNTAAAGALGKMLIKLAKQEGLTCINIVRRKEQVQELQKQGAAIVLNSSEEDFYSQLKETYKKTNVKVILDAIGGEISNTLLTPAPEDATLICYASLTREMMQINPVPILRFGKTIEGFHLAYWTKRQSMVKLLRTVKKAQRLIANDILSTPVQKKVDLNEINGAIKLYKENMTAGKVLIAF